MAAVSTLPHLPSSLTHPVETYISPAPTGSTTKVLYYITDVIGHKFINAQLLADAYAAHGFHVVMPDLFHGDPWLMNSEGNIMDWINKHQPEHVGPVVDQVFAAIKSELKPTKIAAVGLA